MSKFVRHESSLSYNSEDLDDDEPSEYNVTPWDIETKHPDLGTIIVAKAGESLPFISKYKSSNDSNKLVRFKVDKNLNVSIEKERLKPDKLTSDGRREKECSSGDQSVYFQLQNVNTYDVDKLNFSLVEEHSPVDNRQNTDHSLDSLNTCGFVRNNSGHENVHSDGSKASSNDCNARVDMGNISNVELPQGPSSVSSGFRSQGEFLMEVNDNFVEKVVDALQVRYRDSVKEKIRDSSPLDEKEDMAIVHGINELIYKEFEKKPDRKFFSKVAEILKAKLPETYAIQTAVKTDFGTMPVAQKKGHGGSSDLTSRLSMNFYNRLMRPKIEKAMNKRSISVESSKPKKKIPKNYEVDPERYNAGSSSRNLDQEEIIFSQIKLCSNIDEKLQLLNRCRSYIQKQFREKEPGQLVIDMNIFFSEGVLVLDDWFQWITKQPSNLSQNAEKNFNKVMNLVKDYLIYENGREVEAEIIQSKTESEASTGSLTFHYIFLLRQLSKVFKNKVSEAIFLSGTDKQQGFTDLPFIHVSKKNVLGEGSFGMEVVISLRVNDVILYDSLSLIEAITALVQLYFAMHLHYPDDCDDMYQLFQRIFCVFGSADGARNKRDTTKRAYNKFKDFIASTYIQADGAEITNLYC